MKERQSSRLDEVVAQAQRDKAQRDLGYRERALKMYPWVCGRCSRSFDHRNLQELTVHHRDHNHDNNPLDGSNWELLCVYCHDNEHQRQALRGTVDRAPGRSESTHKPFAALADLLKRDS
jgi:5-methylcytosine-specific restriction endonuclease McrA